MFEQYSDPQMPATSITMTVTGDSALSGSACTISNNHDRKFITQYGPLGMLTPSDFISAQCYDSLL